MSQITTLTFFRYTSFRAKVWAFWMMQFAHGELSRTQGLELYKLMGSGKKNFNPLPDWSVYALLQVWNNELSADRFFKDAELIKRYRQNSDEQWTIYMRSIAAKGEWSGKKPFIMSDAIDSHNSLITVITRATIKPRRLLTFWKYVPNSQRQLSQNEGLIFTKGIGEVPFLQMATFSLWKNKESLHNFAYNDKGHQKAIQKTRELDWYKEELFSRFQPYRSLGTWGGVNPLSGVIDQK